MAISDDVIYGGLLILSIPFGLLIRRAESWQNRQYLSSAVGASIVVLVCGIHSLHSLLTIAINCVIISLLGPKLCHIGSFIWCFSYLLFFRLTTSFGLPAVPPYANAVQLILTLKLVGVAFEVHDSYMNKITIEKTAQEEDRSTLQLKHDAQVVKPSVTDMFMYSYCYIGILTGPYYKYRTYHDMVHEKNTKNINLIEPLIQKLKWLPVFAALFIFLGKYFSIQYVRTVEFYEEPFWLRFSYMVPLFFVFRLRFYCAWLLAECMCITAALGAYPAASKPRIGGGPTDMLALKQSKQQSPESVAYSFEAVHNMDHYGMEVAVTVRDAMRRWNMTVQYWMASTVYKRLPYKSHALRSAITMFVSAYWHGVHPGYHLSFLTTIPAMIAEDALAKAFRNGQSPARQKAFDWFCWFMSCRIADYMSMGFMLLSWEDTHRYWGSIYYAGHVWTLIFIAIGYAFAPKRERQKLEKDSMGVLGSKATCSTESQGERENSKVEKKVQ